MTRRNYDEKMGKTDTEKGIGGHCYVPMSFSLGGKKVPYFTSYNFKEQALRNF